MICQLLGQPDQPTLLILERGNGTLRGRAASGQQIGDGMVITIERQFGAGGTSVGRIVARALGARLLAGELVGEVARRLGLRESEVARADEQPTAKIERLLDGLRYLAPPMPPPWSPPRPEFGPDQRTAIVQALQEAIRDAARAGDVVIVGRGAAFVLRDHPGARHVFLDAATDLRLHVVMRRSMLDAGAARARVEAVDGARAAYIRELYHADWRDPVHYDLVLNTGRLGHDRAAQLVVAMSRLAGWRPARDEAR